MLSMFYMILALLDCVSRANAVAWASVVRPAPVNAFSQKPSSKLMPNFVERLLSTISPDNTPPTVMIVFQPNCF